MCVCVCVSVFSSVFAINSQWVVVFDGEPSFFSSLPLLHFQSTCVVNAERSRQNGPRTRKGCGIDYDAWIRLNCGHLSPLSLCACVV